ncbi:MAG: hypothetical protein VYA34_13755 [Myxococcota bacterium]|nr:hypothetical protein [Myxococcota bacterium]
MILPKFYRQGAGLFLLVMGTAVGCGDGNIYSGPINIKSDRDVAFYGRYNQVDGNLTIANTGIHQASWPNLTKVTGLLFVENNRMLTSLDLPNLEEVGMSLQIKNNDNLTELNLNSLDTVGTTVGISYNDRLACASAQDAISNLDLPSDSISITGNLDCP